LSPAVRPRRERPRFGRLPRAGRAAALFLAAAVALAAPPLARAQDAQADALLKDGKKLMGAGKLAEACPKLEESHKLSPKSSTLLEVATCHEKQGKIATAWTEYIDAEGEARKEGRSKVEADAKQRSRKLDAKLPRVTVTVPKDTVVEGLEIKIDGALLDKGDWGKSRPLDPGDHKLTAWAPGRKAWEQAVSIKISEKKTVTIPALAADASSTSAPPTPPPAAPVATAPPTTTAAPPPPPPETPKEPEQPEESSRKAGRLVFDVSAMGGFLGGFIDAGGLSGLETYDYTYNLKDGVYVDLCEDKCRGLFDPAFGVYVGASLFGGYAISETFQIGARATGGPRIGGGYVVLGGPSLSLKLGAPLWIGGTLLVGGIQQSAKVAGIRGEVPADAVQFNNDQSEVDVTRKANTPEEDLVGTFSFGASLDVSFMLVDRPVAGWSSGSLMLSTWPMFVKGLSGFAFAVPVGIGYRFY
jgi:hypothetical protein